MYNSVKNTRKLWTVCWLAQTLPQALRDSRALQTWRMIGNKCSTSHFTRRPLRIVRFYRGVMFFFYSVSAMFKTIPVTAITTVTDVIQIALEKFGLKVWSLAMNAQSCHNTWISHVTTDDWKSRKVHNPHLHLGLAAGVWYGWPPYIFF